MIVDFGIVCQPQDIKFLKLTPNCRFGISGIRVTLMAPVPVSRHFPYLVGLMGVHAAPT